MLGNFAYYFRYLLIIIQIMSFLKLFEEFYQSVKQLGSISGPTFCPSNYCKSYQQTKQADKE